jgi:hypothetical protein
MNLKLDPIVRSMVLSRGRVARTRGEGKTDNPYREDQPYFDLWEEGWKDMNEYLKFRGGT